VNEERLAQLEAEARHAADKLALYRAKRYSGRETSPVRMRELELRAAQTADRLAAARRDAG
jgi:hypothetical protein